MFGTSRKRRSRRRPLPMHPNVPAGVDCETGAYDVDAGTCHIKVTSGEELLITFISAVSKETYDSQTDVCSDC